MKKCADENPGHSVFDVNGVNIYTPKTTSFSLYLVRVSIPDLNIRKGSGAVEILSERTVIIAEKEVPEQERKMWLQKQDIMLFL